MTDQKPIEELTFREAKAQLDEIVRLLDSNTLELEQSLDTYERGIALLSSLKMRLDGATQRVDELIGKLEQRDENITDSTLS
ncbi:MAG: exodeoxyribonuclease VII small subunit [Eggerthellaceae bacterium]|nr:exodeoxyribonuclease VII small subunit [Eggerthellaceae bacterium]